MRTRYTLVFAFAALAFGVLLFSAPRHAAAVTNCDTTDASYDSEEQAFLQLINSYREQNGLGALASSPTLDRSSAWKSQHMAANAYFAHDDTPIGRTWDQRIRDCGYTYNSWIGENIAAGMSTAAEAFNAWKSSPGHNANMLSVNYNAIGIARAYVAGSPYGWYWTTDFGGYVDASPATATPMPTATPTSVPPTATPPPPPGSFPCADLTGDHLVSVADILFVVSHYQQPGTPADLDRSGVVDVTDILIVIHQFNTPC